MLSATAISTPPPDLSQRSARNKLKCFSVLNTSLFGILADNQVSVRIIISAPQVSTNDDKSSRLLITLRILVKRKLTSDVEFRRRFGPSYAKGASFDAEPLVSLP